MLLIPRWIRLLSSLYLPALCITVSCDREQPAALVRADKWSAPYSPNEYVVSVHLSNVALVNLTWRERKAVFGTEKQPFFDWMRIAMTSQDASKGKICGNLENSGVCLILRLNSAIAESWRDCQTLTEQSRFRERAVCISTTHLYLFLSDCSSTRIFKRTHMYRNIWTTANQRGGPPFTISD